jgi:purine-binding chemotaxis protein CheW
MKNQSLLTFTLHGLFLAIDTKVVREIIWLPELTILEECPGYMAGVINMHGKIVPVVDLNRRFGHPPQRYSCSDRVIVLDVSGISAEFPDQPADIPDSQSPLSRLGIIVNEVLDVLDIPEEDIEPPPFAGRELRPHSRFVSGEAKTGDGIVMILDSWKILDHEFEVEDSDTEIVETPSPAATSYFCPEADRHEKEIFHERAVQLRPALSNSDSVKLIAVAVVSLNGEFLCLELGVVREFAKIHNFTTVPCCPRHIAGNMNLRGNVLTVVDIRGLLNMPEGKISELTKVVVADLGEFAVGLLVDEIVDVIYLRETEIVAVPASIRALNEKFVKGAAPFAGRLAVLLDLPAILAWDGLIVNEEV